MIFFFVGQLVRIVNAPACPSLVGEECTIVADTSLEFGDRLNCWELSLPNAATGRGWLCKKETAPNHLTPAIPPELEIEEEVLVTELYGIQGGNVVRFFGLPEIPSP